MAYVLHFYFSNFTFDFDIVNPATENNGELLLQVLFINANEIKDTVKQALGTRFANFAENLFGQVHLKINGEEPYRRKPGVYGVYVRKDTPKKAQLFVEKSGETNEACEKLHLLEVRLLEYNGRVIGGM